MSLRMLNKATDLTFANFRAVESLSRSSTTIKNKILS